MNGDTVCGISSHHRAFKVFMSNQASERVNGTLPLDACLLLHPIMRLYNCPPCIGVSRRIDTNMSWCHHSNNSREGVDVNGVAVAGGSRDNSLVMID